MIQVALDHVPHTIPEAFIEIGREKANQFALQMKVGKEYRRFTYQEVVHHVQGLASGFIREGLRPEGRVAIFSENRPEWVITYLAIVSAGGTAVPLDFQMMEQEVMSLVAESESQMLVASERTISKLKSLPPNIRVVLLDCSLQPCWLKYRELLEQGLQSPMPKVTIRPENVASLLYTSGTTGKPKGVLLTHRNLLADARSMMSSGLAGADDNFLVMLPLHHAYPFMIAFLVPLLLGARLTFLQSLKGPDLLQCLQETKITMVVGVPQVFAMIRRAILDQLSHRHPFLRVLFTTLLILSGLIRRATGMNVGRVIFRAVHRRFGGSIRLLCSGGAKLDPQVARDLERLGFTIREGYGLTETSPVVAFNPVAKPKIDSVGTSIPGVELRIVNPDAQGVGEVAVKGPIVMKGYDRNPQATAEAIREGWFHTGDLGYLDSQGYLFLTGRIKELIVTAGGKKVYPEELEKVYQTSPAIKEICLVGTKPSGKEAEGIQAIVLPDFDFLKAEKVPDIRLYIKDELTRIGLTLPPYKRIAGIVLVKEPLPRTRLGKIQRHELGPLLETERRHEGKEPVLSEHDQAMLASETGQRVLSALMWLLPKAKAIHLDDHLDLDLGLDSLQRVELVAALEQQFGSLPEALAMDVITVRDVVEKVQALVREPSGERAPSRQSWHDLLQVKPPLKQTDRLLRSPRFWERWIEAGIRFTMWLVFRFVFHLSVKGVEYLPRHKPFLLAANHVSHLDPFVVLLSIPPSVFDHLLTLGWETYFQGWFRAWVGRLGHVLTVGTDTPLDTLLQIVAFALRHGKSMLIFPEGERSIDGHLLPFRKGIGIVACETGVPVVPVWIEGTYQVLPVGKRWPRRHTISLYFGKPCTISRDLRKKWTAEEVDVYKAAAELIREQMLELKKEIAA